MLRLSDIELTDELALHEPIDIQLVAGGFAAAPWRLVRHVIASYIEPKFLEKLDTYQVR